ncbi:unnamed protein product [Pleuronectes platessa]|uniref:WH1 domain-containing protein n=1 Tax=Pleuronectes platessa TaxID=8262 RepID=A0A9N7TTZ2_PLEPL|nr:unnamed protein product [Pleuronectes platessa]
MSGHPQQRRQANSGSTLLSAQQNELLFQHLGRKCIGANGKFHPELQVSSPPRTHLNSPRHSCDTPLRLTIIRQQGGSTSLGHLSSAVAQVFVADRNSSWSKKCGGVACLVKDNPLRSYFIRVLELKDGKILFEQELYNNFSVNTPKPYFITFAGDLVGTVAQTPADHETCQVGLNFASEDETKRFHGHLTELVGKRQRKTEKRRDPPNENGRRLWPRWAWELDPIEPLSSTMMFCTTFLSAPSEELNPEGSGVGGGTAMGGGGLGPGSCLSSLHCLVLPQDDLYPSLSDPTARRSVGP